MLIHAVIASVSALPITIFWLLYHFGNHITDVKFPINLDSVGIANIIMFGAVMISGAVWKFLKKSIVPDAMVYTAPTIFFSIVPFFIAQEVPDRLFLGLSIGLTALCAMGIAGTIKNTDFPFWKTTLRFWLAGIVTAISAYIVLNNYTHTAIPLEVTSFVPSILFLLTTGMASISFRKKKPVFKEPNAVDDKPN